MSVQSFANQSFAAEALVLENGAQKRALSYALTMHQLLQTTVNGRLPADRVLGNYFREHKRHGSKDRRVIRETLFGIFRWWGYLQQIPAQNASQPLLAVLASVGQLEQHAWQDIVDAWASLAALEAHESHQGLCYFPDINCEPKQLLPDWFWQSLSKDAEPEAIAEAMRSRPPIWARAQNTSRKALIKELESAELPVRSSDYFSDALSLGSKSINLAQLPAYQQGRLEIQDLASQVIGYICAPKANERWWDACAGAGGKSLQLASLAKQQGVSIEQTASDIRLQALTELQKRAARAQVKIAVAPWQESREPVTELPVEKQSFDGVLVDAPCSCTGTWRRNPDLRWLDDASAISNKPALQLDILSRASQAVKVGGCLVYATCSLAEAENEGVVQAFLAQFPAFELQTVTHPFTQEKTTMLTVWPHQANSDGMFVVKMQRIG